MDSLEPSTTPEPLEPDAHVSAQPIIYRALPLWKIIFILAVPIWIQQFLQLAVSISDTALAGRFLEIGDNQNVLGQAAQTTAGYMMWFLVSFAVLVSAGSTALVARFVGARDWSKAVHVTNQSILLAVVFGTIGCVVGLLFVEQLIAALQLDAEASAFAIEYLRPIFIALPFQMIETVGIACLIGAGDTVTGMLVGSGVAIINIPLSWAFSQGWGPLPALGLAGISTGTAVAYGVGCLVILLILFRGRAGLELRISLLRPNLDLIRRILRISVPAGIDSLSVIAGQLWFISIVNELGAVASAAHGIAIRCEALGFLTGAAFQVAAMTLVGQYLGAENPRLASRSGWLVFWVACAIISFMGVIFFTFAEPMFAFFCPRPEQRGIIEIGVPALRLVAFAMPSVTACMIFTGALRGAGDTRVPVLITWFGFLAVRIPLAYYLTGPVGWGLMGAWWAMFADLAVRGSALTARFAWGRWKSIKV